jgi:hypothetical protein
MAALPAAEIDRLWKELMEEASARRESMPFTKDALRAALVAADAYQESIAVAYNNALPAAFRNNATAGQKSILFERVARRRREVL